MNIRSMVPILLTIILTGCGAVISKSQYGVQDDTAASAILRINAVAAIRDSFDFHALSDRLKNDLEVFRGNPYALARIRAELADVYSHQLLDIEKAIELDGELLRASVPDDDDKGEFAPRHHVASQRILANKNYLNSYVAVPSARLAEEARSRLAVNASLIRGERSKTGVNYNVLFLRSHFQSVQKDIDSTIDNSPDRYRILSRLVRAEYELLKLDKSLRPIAYLYVLNGNLPLERIDLAEINFLILADYFTLIFEATNNIRFAEYALQTIYRPYTNMRDPESRWKYNKIINGYISTLIDANYKHKRFDEMLYYISLNKSRMLLEERLAYGSKQNTKTRLTDLAADDGIPRDRNGLPEKSWFLNKLAATDRFLDFYVSGQYVPAKENRGAMVRHYADASAMPLTSRNVGAVQDDGEEEVFDDNSMYITYISNGKALVRKAIGQELESFRHELDKSYETMSSNKSLPAVKSPSFSKLAEGFNLPQEFTVSPDKWLSKHPMDYHFNARTVRAVNFFTGADYGRLNAVKIAGFFNPTLVNGKGSLRGADQEAEVIRKLAPAAKIIRRDDAHLSALMQAGDANIIHLSMHGSFDPKDPLRSKLYFAGSRFELTQDDPNALYAENMSSYEALRGRDLIFAAACETGLAKADSANQSEQTGMIRSLTANRNRNVILSLWSVDDQATKEFVEAFYERLVVGKDITEAFRHAQGEVRQKYPHPKYWAAFYLSKS